MPCYRSGVHACCRLSAVNASVAGGGMTVTSLAQRSAAGGVLSPQLWGRVDQAKYASGLRQSHNGLVTRQGAWENRPGTYYVKPVKQSGAFTRIEPFIVGSTGFVLEFGDLCLRIWYNDSSPVALTDYHAWTVGTIYDIGGLASNGGEYFYSSRIEHPPAWLVTQAYIANDRVVLAGALSGQIYLAVNAVTGGLGPGVDTTNWLAVAPRSTIPCPTVVTLPTGAGTANTGDRVLYSGNVYYCQYTLSPAGFPAWDSGSMYALGDHVVDSGVYYVCITPITLPYIGYVPAAHPTFWNPVVGSTSFWTFQPTPTAGGDAYWFKEPAPTTAFEIPTNIPQVSLPIFQYAQINDVMYFAGQDFYPSRLQHNSQTNWAFSYAPVGNTQMAPVGALATQVTGPGTIPWTYVVTAINPDNGEESLVSNEANCTSSYGLSVTTYNTVLWTAITGVKKYNIYRKENGSYCYIGTSGTVTFVDTGIIPLISIQPPIQLAMFATASDYPAVIGAYQQRLIYANSINQPQSVWASRIGTYQSFPVSTPTVDNDAVYFVIAGKTKQEVRALVDIGTLIIHTSNGEYIAKGNQYGTITPTTINLVQQGYVGAKLLGSTPIGNTDLFAQARGNIIRDFRFEIQSYQYAGKDLTKFAPDLFKGKQIVCMCFQQVPQSILWVVLDDGTLLGLTYVREDELWAWHGPHDTGIHDKIEWACVIPSAGLDILYLAVQRTVLTIPLLPNGSPVRNIERLYPRDFLDIRLDAHFVDCGGVIDGRNVTTAAVVPAWGTHTMTVTAPAIPLTPTSWGCSPGGDFYYSGGSFNWVGMSGSAVAMADMGATVTLTQYTIGRTGTTPANWTLEGSATGVGGWVTLDTNTGGTGAVTKTLGAPATYRYFRITFTGCGGYPPGWYLSITLDAAGSLTPTDLLTLTASSSTFVAGDVGNAVVLYEMDPDGFTILDQVTLNILAYTSATVVSVQPSKTVPAWAQAALATWGKAIKAFTGHTELAGATISILADGVVQPPVVVSVAGAFAIQNNAVVVHYGLPYTSEGATLDWENTQGETIQNKKKLVVEMTPRFYRSRGGEYGQDDSHTFPISQRPNEDWADPTFLLNDHLRIPVAGAWQLSAELYWKQTQPLPLSISCITAAGQIGN